MRRVRACMTVVAMALGGCAGARERFGEVARFAPEVDGYVVGEARAPTVLVDPISSAKLRCAEDVERSLPALRASLEAAAIDARAHERARAALFPLTATSVAAVHLGLGMFLLPVPLLEPFVAPTRREIYEKARGELARGRLTEARDDFRIVVYAWNDDTPYDPLPREYVDLARYELGALDDALGDRREATEALARFVAYGTWRGDAPYRDAEERLARLDPGRAPSCRSRADVRLAWGAP